MNTNGFLIFSTILLVFMYLLVHQYDPDYEENMAKFVREDALVYIEQRDGRKALEDFRKSKLAKNLEAIDFQGVGEEVGLSADFSNLLEAVQNNYFKLFDHNFIDILVGKRFGLAFYEPENGAQHPSVRSLLKESSLIIAEPKIDGDILQYIALNYSHIYPQIAFQKLQYGNHRITRMTVKGESIAFALIEGLFVASFNESLLRDAIDAYDEGNTLFARSDFTEAQTYYEKPERLLYLPMDTVYLLADYLYDLVPQDHIPIFQQQLDLVDGFTGLLYGAWSRGEYMDDKIILTYQEEQVVEGTEKFLQTAPGMSSMLELTTSDPLAYYWSNTIDLKTFLQYLPDRNDKEHPVNRYLDKLEEMSHQGIEEIVATFGDEVSLVLEKNSDENFLPVPRAAVFFRMNTGVDLSEMVNYIVDAFEVPVIEQLYNSVTYLYWVASPQDGLQPLCGYWSNIFFIGNSGSLIEQIIDGYNENSSILSNTQIKKIDPGVSEANNSVTYLNNEELLGLTERLFSALATISTLEDREKAEKARIVINKIIHPFFSGLQQYERSFTRSYFLPGMVIIDSKTSVSQNRSH